MNATARRSTLDGKPSTRLEALQQDMGPAPEIAPTPSGSRPALRWYVIATYAQAERRAAHCLTQQGFHVYLPMLVVQRRDRHTPTLLHRLEQPLFPAYLFVQLDLRDPWGPIRNTPGVFRLLTNADNMPDPVPEAVILAVQAGDAIRRLPTPDTPLLRPGAPVTCLYGPFQGREAVVISAAANTVRVALLMMGAIREVVVPVQILGARD